MTNANIIGTWVNPHIGWGYVGREGFGHERLSFYDNGAATRRVVADDDHIVVEDSGTYRARRHQLTLTEVSQNGTIVRSVLQPYVTSQHLVLAPYRAVGAHQGVVGRWQSRINGHVDGIELRADGSCRLSTSERRHSVEAHDGSYTVDANGGVTMTLADEPDSPLRFYLVDGAVIASEGDYYDRR